MHSQVLPIPPCTWTAVSQTVRAARGAVRLGHPAGGARFVGVEGVDGPRGVEGDAERSLHQAHRFGEQVLHRLEGSDGHAELPAFGGVCDREVEHAPHEPDEVGARERQPEGGP